MAFGTDDLVAAHAVFGTATEIIEQRRAVYQAPIELLAEDTGAAANADILDHPITRGHLADVLSGAAEYDGDALFGLSQLVGEPLTTLADRSAWVAEASRSNAVLAPALRRVAAELGRRGVETAPPAVLTRGDAAFPAALARLRDGVELAARLVPALALDLLSHVALFALLGRDRAGRLGSASAREYPGLVMVPDPSSALEAAEAFVHEGAHQKFFDLAITRSVLGPDQYAAPGFARSWAVEGQPAWPLEQTFAAYHAYRCLAAFMDALGDHPDLVPVAPSLLPVAAARTDEIGDWLRRQARFLGPDGRALLAALTGQPTEVDGVPAPSPTPVADLDTDEDTFVRRCGDRTLVARRGRPIRLLWVNTSHRSAGHAV